jgi:hypothetical protein
MSQKRRRIEENFSNFPGFIEPNLKHKYQEDSIRESDDYWLQINCADGKHITVSFFCVGSNRLSPVEG